MDRRSVLGALVSSGLGGIAGCLGGGSTDATTPVMNREVPTGGGAGPEIPQLQGSAEHTGELDTTGPTDGVTTYWRRTPHRYEHSQPVVDDERVYVVFAGSLVCLDRSTGQRQWLTDVGHAGATTPAVHDGTVYITVWNGGEHEDRGLAAVDAESGEVDWRALTAADITTAPAVTDAGVFVGGGFETSTVAAFDHDGTERWRHTLGEYASTPAVTDGTVVYGAGTARVVAYDAVSGDQQWAFETDGETTVAPTVVGDRVVVGTRAGTLYGLDRRSGAEDWRFDLPGSLRQSIAAAADRLIVPADEGLVAVDTEGNREWRVDTITRATAPVVAGESVYLGERKVVHALSVADGTERWSFETRERNYGDVVLQGIRTAPTVTDGVVIVATEAGDVYALGEK